MERATGISFTPTVRNGLDEIIIPIRVRTGLNIPCGAHGQPDMTLGLELRGENSGRFRACVPPMRIVTAGGKGCQTRVQNPSCAGFWQWPGFDPLIGPATCTLE